jgi:glucosylceramidase
LLEAFFGQSGAGLNVLTTGMSGSGYDNNGPASFTYDDIQSGTDFPQKHFSVSHDDAYIVPVLHQILEVNPNVKLFGVPYSAPAWMKDSDKLDTGTFIGKPKYERSFATYFVKYVQEYRKRNLPIYALAMENEPDYVAGTYPSMLLSAKEEARIIGKLGPALRDAGLSSVNILGWDHNWSVPPGTKDQGNGRMVHNSSGADDGFKYPATLLSSPVANTYLAGTAYHCYGGDPTVQGKLRLSFPAKGIWNIECAGGPLETSWQEAFRQNMGLQILPEIQNWSRSHVWWTLVQDQDFGPQYGNCTSANCSPLVTIDSTTTPARLVYLPGYYMLAHIGRFVRPGAFVISSEDSGIPEVAFRNPDGSYVLVACNRNASAAPLTVKWSGLAFGYILAPNAIVTFTWKPNPAA